MRRQKRKGETSYFCMCALRAAATDACHAPSPGSGAGDPARKRCYCRCKAQGLSRLPACRHESLDATSRLCTSQGAPSMAITTLCRREPKRWAFPRVRILPGLKLQVHCYPVNSPTHLVMLLATCFSLRSRGQHLPESKSLPDRGLALSL